MVAAVPLVGGPGQVALAEMLDRPYQIRRDRWLDSLQAEAERANLRLDDIGDDPAFLDAVVMATRAAQATHSEEKLQALRAAVVNSLGPNSPSEDERARFFRCIDEMTPAHLRMLRIMDDPREALAQAGASSAGNVEGLIKSIEPQFNDPEWCRLVASDLDSAYLAAISGVLRTMMTPQGVLEPRTTPLGKRFLAFVAQKD